jgi:hypothetical protein
MNKASVEIDLNEFDKKTLIALILFFAENDLTFNDAIVKLLKDNLPKLEDERQMSFL